MYINLCQCQSGMANKMISKVSFQGHFNYKPVFHTHAIAYCELKLGPDTFH